MKSLLTAILCLAAVATTRAAEPQSKFAGRWVGYAEFLGNKGPGMNYHLAQLAIEVDPQGVITNSTIRDFNGKITTGFTAQLDPNGQVDTVIYTASGKDVGHLILRLGRTKGIANFYTRKQKPPHYLHVFRCWREEKVPDRI